jgi:hypothetical protein
MPYAEPMETAVRKARHGHRDWLYWRDRAGQAQIGPATAENLKAAMLACGTQKSFTLIEGNTTRFHKMTWPIAVTHRAHALRGWTV